MWGWQCTQRKFFLRESVVFFRVERMNQKRSFPLVSGKSCKKNLKCQECHTWMILPLSFMYVILRCAPTLWVSILQLGLLHCSTHPWWFSSEILTSTKVNHWGVGFKHFFHFLPGEMIQFDFLFAYFSKNGWGRKNTNLGSLYFHFPQKKGGRKQKTLVNLFLKQTANKRRGGIPCSLRFMDECFRLNPNVVLKEIPNDTLSKSILPKLLYEPCNYVGKLWKLELLFGFFLVMSRCQQLDNYISLHLSCVAKIPRKPWQVTPVLSMFIPRENSTTRPPPPIFKERKIRRRSLETQPPNVFGC